MKTILYKSMLLCLMALTFTACKDEDEDIPGGVQEEAPADDAQANLEAYEQFMKRVRHNDMRVFVENLTYEDPAENAEVRAVMKHGLRLDESDPTVFTTGVESFEEAEEMFLQSLVPNELDSLYTQEGYCQMDFGEYGSATFQKNTSGGALLATLNISIDSIPHITQLRFVSNASLPENNGVFTFTRGQIIMDTYDNNRKYICVSSINQGNPCRLICFSRTREEMTLRWHNTTIFRNCIDLNMAKSLRAFIMESNGLWEKAERVYYLKYGLKRHQYCHDIYHPVLLSSGDFQPPFTHSTENVKWVLNTEHCEKSSGWWFWKTTWGWFNFKWYDYHTNGISSAERENKKEAVTYVMPEAIAMQGVSLDVIDTNRWKVADNITTKNYKDYPEH